MAPALFGIPIEIVVFLGVMACIMLFAPFILAAGTQSHMSKRASKLRRRMDSVREKPKEVAENRSLRRQEGDASLPLISRLFARMESIERIRDRLSRAGITTTAERYLSYNLLLFCLTSLIAILLLGKGLLFSLLVGLVIGLGIPHMVVNFRIGRRTKKFLLLFPDAIDLIVRGLRAGLPVTESIKMVSKEIDEPVGSVFRTMAEKMALGVPLERTLYETAVKYRITEFDFFVTSIVLQRETGGNLSEILNNLSEALRQRLMMRMKIKAMSSEAKASMYIIGFLPFFVMGALAFTSPDYLTPLFNDYRGNIALFIAGGMLSMGVFIMSRMTKFEI